MISLTLKGLWAHKRRLLGMCTAVVLGVTFLAATLTTTDTMDAGFDDLFERSNAGTDAVVRGDTSFGDEDFEQRQPLPASTVDDVRAVGGVAAPEPAIEGIPQIVSGDGEPIGGEGPPTLAGNWVDDSELNPWRIAEGHAPDAPGQVVIDRKAATDGDLGVGDAAVVMTPAPIDVEIVGIATFGGDDSLGSSTFTFFTYDDAQQYFLAGHDQITTVVARGDPGFSQDQLAARIAPILPAGLEVITGTDLTAEQLDQLGSDFLDLVRVFFLTFTVIALIVATFSIYNTFSVVSAQRTRESALLRAIGAS